MADIYKARIPLPSLVQELIQELQGVGGITRWSDQYVEVEFEADDGYELATIVKELEATLGGIPIYDGSPTIDRPVMVAVPTPTRPDPTVPTGKAKATLPVKKTANRTGK